MSKTSQLNDLLRTTLAGGRVEMTHDLAALPECERRAVLQRLRTLNPKEGDMISSEGDSGSFATGGRTFRFKIRYYQYSGAANFDDVFEPVVLSPATNPDDPAMTLRVLTLSIK